MTIDQTVWTIGSALLLASLTIWVVTRIVYTFAREGSETPKRKVEKSKSKTQHVVIHDGCGGIVGELDGGGGIQWLCTKCDRLWEFFEDRTDVWLFTPKRQITGSIIGDTAVGQGHVHGPGWGGVRFKDGSVEFPK